MSGANYEYCPVCDQKALYVGEEDVGAVVVIHEACLEQEREAVAARAAAAERARIRSAVCADGLQNTLYAYGLRGNDVGDVTDAVLELIGETP